ncbi:ABC transporter substrate-binding protein [Roseobacter sp. HKCCD9010]|uniref:ABC transporter substrate-binding protein n=1 Tax=unclassified Roseobacter TaxID=196798 RepID=UPI0014928980|nr:MULTISPECIES: ABC transporter substrate-binding protein [unclassified Roseobacter]MBF9050820.1 ABC transporter substrate-binding protein [Rhodobacterales bacterium HKCCD4356]NNV11762.1 ABC transporter substrate-binding protein [Roseobacter sp. HKCCD7357]NNV17913.1 ABC transporter substrate-binding protein [Roseobacter sp. HKCCD8768]NNV26004.1 ABC transporter substrate-binding protein [Roseobacter sp. HKCCD8192]NNV31640.1 ABC transporter substrate-binding protein [Roseobacter sp. HKCCD9061]
MKRREFLATSIIATGALGFGFGPGPLRAQEPVSGGTLIWGHSETTQNLDMHQTGTASTARVLQNIHDSIVTINSEMEVVPQLAESFEVSEDGLTYTFNLRDGVKFHDGSTMTAEDVIYSFERCRDPEVGAVNFEVFNDVDAFEAPDDLTVVIRMSRPNAPFLARLAENGAGVVMPAGSGDTQGTAPTGAGAFRFMRREFGNEVELERFDEYWDGPAYLDGILAREITEPTVRLTGLQTGELHFINDIPAERVAQVEGDADLQVVTWAPLNFDFLNFNHDRELFQDRRVRLAFDLMIDKEALLQGALWAQGDTTPTPSFPNDATRNGDLTQRAQDIAQAQALLEEAGYPPGTLNVVFKVTTNYPYHVDSAQIIAEWARAAGVNMTIEQLTWADWLSQVWVDRDFEMTMMNFFTIWEPDRLYYSLYHSTGGFNYRSISDPLIDELTEQARGEVDPAARLDLYRRIQQHLFDEALDVILWYRNGTIGAAPEVGGLDTVVHPNGSNLNFHKVWLAS